MSDDRTEIDDLAQRLLDLHSKLKTWQKVGDIFGVPKIIVWRIAKDDYEPKKNEVRRALGLSEIIEIKQRRNAKGQYVKNFGD